MALGQARVAPEERASRRSPLIFQFSEVACRSFPQKSCLSRWEMAACQRIWKALETLSAGLSKRIDLKLVSRLEFGSRGGAMRLSLASWSQSYLVVISEVMKHCASP